MVGRGHFQGQLVAMGCVGHADGVTKVLISNAGAGVDDLSRQPIEGVFPELEGLQLINPPNRM
jgi:hypothetical protein